MTGVLKRGNLDINTHPEEKQEDTKKMMRQEEDYHPQATERGLQQILSSRTSQEVFLLTP